MKMNPNSFFKFNGQWHSAKSRQDMLCALTIPYKDVNRLEALEDENKTMHYNLFVKSNFNDKPIRYSITKEDYEKIGSQLEQVDFDIPIIKTQEQIKETVKDVVKEELNKRKTSNPILSLEV